MTESEKQRLDKWLFFARIVKSRTLAASLINGGKARVNHNKVDKAAFMVKTGDCLTITLPNRIFAYKILELGERRNSAAEAQGLYEDLSPPAPPREKLLEATIIRGKKPTKKERRKALVLTQHLD